MKASYLDNVNLGKNQWYYYLSAVILILAFWLFLGGTFSSIVMIIALLDNNPGTYLDPQTLLPAGFDPLINYITINLSFVVFLIGIYIAMVFIHQRKLFTLITTEKKINFKRIFTGFGVFFALIAASSLLEYAIAPETYQISLNLPKFLISIPLALILTSIQITTEELFFRGYILQSFSLATKNIAALLAISGIIFTAPHLLNMEVIKSFSSGIIPAISGVLYYFIVGVLLSLITVKSNSLELAIGAHAAVNLFVVLFVSFKYSSLQLYPVFYTTRFDPVYNLVTIVIISVVYYFILFKVLKVNQDRG